MSFLKTPCTRFVAWSLTIALVANGPMLSAEQRVSDTQGTQTPEYQSAMQDVKLEAGGVLTARIVDLQGNPVIGEQVSVTFQGKEIAAVVSDENGFAAVSGLRPGLHAILTPTGTTACRLWNADTAPPTATSIPAVVSDAEIIRGQMGAFNLPQFLVLGTSIAALIVALDARNTANGTQDDVNALAARVQALEAASP